MKDFVVFNKLVELQAYLLELSRMTIVCTSLSLFSPPMRLLAGHVALLVPESNISVHLLHFGCLTLNHLEQTLAAQNTASSWFGCARDCIFG